MPESFSRSRDASASSTEALSTSERRSRRAVKRRRAADASEDAGPGPSLLGFVRVDVRSLDLDGAPSARYEEPLECGQVRDDGSRGERRTRDVGRRRTRARGTVGELRERDASGTATTATTEGSD